MAAALIARHSAAASASTSMSTSTSSSSQQQQQHRRTAPLHLERRRRCHRLMPLMSSMPTSPRYSASWPSPVATRAVPSSPSISPGGATIRSTADGRWKRDSHPEVVLVADIGGTNARFVLSRVGTGTGSSSNDGESKNPEEILSVVYPTSRHATFADALSALEREPSFVAPRAAAFAVAGPVARNRCEMTNLSWTIDGDFLTQKLGVRVSVLNDFEAAGYGVLDLSAGDANSDDNDDTPLLLPLNDVPADPKGPIAVLGPGTGLGQAQLFWDADEGHYRVWPSEGAHGGFAPRGWKQRALAGAVEDALGYCEVEHVACGAGLERIYAFLASDVGGAAGASSSRSYFGGDGGGGVFSDDGDDDDDFVAPSPSSSPSSSSSSRRKKGTVASPRVSAPEITAAAALGSDPLAAEAVDVFLSILGAEAGAMALRSLATGGVFLCGGITARLARAHRKRPIGGGGNGGASAGNGSGGGGSGSSSSSSNAGSLLYPSPLLDAFLWKRSKFGKLLSQIPFSAVLDDGLGLRGARVFASRSLSRAQAEEQ